MARLVENHYGKSRVRLLKVHREGERHEVWEWTVGVYLEGEFARHFETGDNSGMMATDTMKNLVYSVAKESDAGTMEEYARDLARLLSERNPQVLRVRVTIEEKLWDHLEAGGVSYGSAFVQRGPEMATTELLYTVGGGSVVRSGIKGLVILKTAKSGFVGFKRDEWTTLPETTDRLLGTEATMVWTYAGAAADYGAVRKHLREILLATFAGHDSLSVQQTLYRMAEEALESEPAIGEIELTMPNRHNNLVDLARFGQENLNEIFVPTDEPHGQIYARVVR